MRLNKKILNAAVGATAVLFAGVHFIPGHENNGPVLNKAIEIATRPPVTTVETATGETTAPSSVEAAARNALAKLSGAVGTLSHPEALKDAFQAYYAYKAEHPSSVKKPYLYFVDYGQPATAKRGYFFDMNKLAIVEGPFTVAHGRGSSAAKYGVPTRFSNASGSAATSLGLYVAQELYRFTGHASGRLYSATGMRLNGVSEGWNDNARARGVVAHGAPYVTASTSGRSEGCPAMEPGRAARLLPRLANGGMVFLFAPNAKWMAGDEWLNGSNG